MPFQRKWPAGRAQAKLLRNLGRDRYVGGPTHQSQRFFSPAIGKNVEERRLLQFRRQRLLQSLVKSGLTRLIFEVGQDDGVFLRQRCCRTRAEIETSGD